MGEMRKFRVLLLAGCLLCTLFSCRKEWLEAKPDKSSVLPTSIADLQALLDNSVQTFNITQGSGLGEISAGDFYVSTTSYNALFNVQEKSAYTWEKTADFYRGEESIDWVNAYARVLNANVVLDGIGKIKPNAAELQDWNNVKGTALFYRAFDLYCLSQQYCPVYTATSATTDLGLPLRLEYDVNITLKRSNLQQTYNQILGDLSTTVALLGSSPAAKTRPSKQAAFALLARAHLAMQQYEQAGLYADSALRIQSELLDYTKLATTGTYLIPRLNVEVIFQSNFSYGIFNTNRLIVEPNLYSSYASNDLRKTAFFTTVSGGVTYRGSYNGDKNFFGGLATDELYLIRAECAARQGRPNAALKDLNYLLQSRWKGNYTPLTAVDQEATLRLVLAERRKELVFRGLRWTDLRRLNKDFRFAVNLSRTLNGQTYTLLPGDKRYTLPIDEVELSRSGIAQNER